MKRLFLNCDIRTKRGPIATFVENADQSWRWEGPVLILRVAGEPEEFVLPSTSVKYEQRARQELSTAAKR